MEVFETTGKADKADQLQCEPENLFTPHSKKSHIYCRYVLHVTIPCKSFLDEVEALNSRFLLNFTGLKKENPTIDWAEFLRALPQEERVITKRLRELIVETEPRLIEKYNYWVPYYVRHKMVCFIWPVSAPNAPKAKNQTRDDTIVSLGFCYGNKLSNEQGLLLAEGRKQVYIIRLKSVKQLDKLENQIREIIMEAVMLDEASKKKSKK